MPDNNANNTGTDILEEQDQAPQRPAEDKTSARDRVMPSGKYPEPNTVFPDQEWG
jgi:hypothetical protein